MSLESVVLANWLVLAVDAGMCWGFVLGNVVLVVGGNWDFPGWVIWGAAENAMRSVLSHVEYRTD